MVTGAAGHHGPPAAPHVVMGQKYELANVTIRRLSIQENPALGVINSRRPV